MRRFLVLLKKELRELLTPQMLVPFLVAVLMFAFLGSILSQEEEKTRSTQSIGVVDLDETDTSKSIERALDNAGFAAVDLGGTAPESMTEELRARNLSIGLYIPEGFEAQVDAGRPADLQTYAVVRSFSLMSLGQTEMLKSVLSAVSSSISSQLIAEGMPGTDPDAVKHPVEFTEHVAVGTMEAPVPLDAVYGLIEQQTLFIPIILFIVIVFASQMIATTIASEKENKTLETLLASPITRRSLVMAKMVAAGLVALLSAAAYLIGLGYYFKGLTGGTDTLFETSSGTVDVASALGLGLETVDWMMLGTTLFLSILIALAMAVIIGGFAESVKSVQALITPLIILTLIPYFLSMLIDIESTAPALRAFVMAIPFTHAFTAAPNLFLGNQMRVVLGAAYQVLWLLALVVIAARIFSTDRILTMKLGFRRRRHRTANP
ncbi:MAG: ABC transporter permease [Coriobacteriia bacterium]|nr:ABC transporter permease [Coriobacteriia bacterium]